MENRTPSNQPNLKTKLRFQQRKTEFLWEERSIIVVAFNNESTFVFFGLNYFHVSMKIMESATTFRADVSSFKNWKRWRPEVDPRWSSSQNLRQRWTMRFDWKNTKPFGDLRHLKLQLIFHYWNGPCWVLTTFVFDSWTWLICMIVGFPCFSGHWVEQRRSLEYQHREAWKYTFYEPNGW